MPVARAATPAVLRPSRAELAAAHGKGIRNVTAPGLRVLFCGINPGLYTAAIGHHFGRPGNRFWPALHRAGLTSRLLSPYEERLLLDEGLGITNLVNYATATADELDREQLQAGGRRLARTVRRLAPRVVAVLGVVAYRQAFDRPHATLGEQPERIADTRVWVLPNPSGLNAHYQLEAIAAQLRAVGRAADRSGGPGVSAPASRSRGPAAPSGRARRTRARRP